MNDELNQYYNTCMVICAPLLAWCWWQVFNYWSKGVLGMGISIYLNSRFTGIIAHPFVLTNRQRLMHYLKSSFDFGGHMPKGSATFNVLLPCHCHIVMLIVCYLLILNV